MKKIKHDVSQKDRIICERVRDKLRFSYRAQGTAKGAYLFEVVYSSSVYHYFCQSGCRVGTNGFSLTIRQMYQFEEYRNFRLTKVLHRIPMMVDYILGEIS